MFLKKNEKRIAILKNKIKILKRQIKKTSSKSFFELNKITEHYKEFFDQQDIPKTLVF